MLEVGVHFKNEVRLKRFYSMVEPSFISLSETLLFSGNQMKVGEPIRKTSDSPLGAIRRVVIHDEDVNLVCFYLLGLFEYPGDENGNILDFVIGWQNDACFILQCPFSSWT